jgi:hypothetical protein
VVESPLKLEAGDAGDLEVVSTCLQDALTRVGDMTYLPQERRFAVVFSRFVWESRDIAPGAAGMRVRAGLHFDEVTNVTIQGIDQSDREGVLPLLAITAETGAAGARITLQFAGGGAVRLEAGAIAARLADMGAPWPTPSRPDHALEDGEGDQGAETGSEET